MLTYILSHRPDEFGLVLSEEGFIPIKPCSRPSARSPAGASSGAITWISWRG